MPKTKKRKYNYRKYKAGVEGDNPLGLTLTLESNDDYSKFDPNSNWVKKISKHYDIASTREEKENLLKNTNYHEKLHTQVPHFIDDYIDKHIFIKVPYDENADNFYVLAYNIEECNRSMKNRQYECNDNSHPSKNLTTLMNKKNPFSRENTRSKYAELRRGPTPTSVFDYYNNDSISPNSITGTKRTIEQLPSIKSQRTQAGKKRKRRKTRKNKNKKKGGGKLEMDYFLAVIRNQTELVLSILERDVDINTKHDDNDDARWMHEGYTALHYACHHRIGNMVHLLIGEGANMEITESTGMKPLHIASQKGYIDIIDILLKYGADINMKKGYEGQDMGNESPGATSLHEVILDPEFITNKLEVVEFLLKNGADINALDDNGNTPLHYAIQSLDVYNDDEYEESIRIANLLINKGADVNISNVDGNTPLHYLIQGEIIYQIAYQTDDKTIELIKTIINKGADYEARNNEGKRPLDHAYEEPSQEWLEFKKVILNHIHNLPEEKERRRLLKKGSEDTKSILSTLPKEVVEQNIKPYLYGGKRKTKKKRNKIKNKK